LPLTLLGKKRHVITPARRTDNALGPTARDQVVKAVVGVREEVDCLLKRFGCFVLRHGEGIVSCLT
jgi:hypothetical protein